MRCSLATPSALRNKPIVDQRLLWLTLLRAPRVGSVTCRTLLDRFGSVAAVFAASRQELRDAGLPWPTADWLQDPPWQAAQADLDWAESAADRRILTLDEPDYPPLLREIPDPPPVLYAAGRVELLDAPQLAIVGSRNPSPMGGETTFHFARALAEAGLVITSGLAQGIDADAHQGALAAGRPTIAVLGTGMDRIYPPRHAELAERIRAQGVLVSELPWETPLHPANFPRRNRIISGLSLGVLVTEANLKSGSLITARLALEQNREVFAIPGSIHNPTSKGCHALIREGAKLVETVDHILEELPGLRPADPRHPASAELPLDADERRLLRAIAYDPVSIDTLVEASDQPPERILALLVGLELKGCIAAAPGGLYYRLG